MSELLQVLEIVNQFWDIAIIILLIIYILFLFILHKYRNTPELSKSFFRLAFYTGIADIYYCIVYWTTYRSAFVIKNETVLKFYIENYPVLGKIIWFLMGFGASLVHCLAVCLAIHRLTAILRPMHHVAVRVFQNYTRKFVK